MFHYLLFCCIICSCSSLAIYLLVSALTLACPPACCSCSPLHASASLCFICSVHVQELSLSCPVFQLPEPVSLMNAPIHHHPPLLLTFMCFFFLSFLVPPFNSLLEDHSASFTLFFFLSFVVRATI